jgi:signal transduction histidine kinase
VSEISEHSASYDIRGATILVIDDNPANLGVLSDYLDHRGFRALVAQSGEIGLKRAQQVRPDLILLDVLLPTIDGFETCRRLKADDATKDIPVLFTTVLMEPKDKLKGFQAGAVDYITKPFQEEEVLARVTTHLRMRKLTHSLQAQNVQLQATQAALRTANEELELRVTERTAELTQTNRLLREQIDERMRLEAQLLQAQKMESIGRLAGGIAHDFNNLLTAIVGYAELADAALAPADPVHGDLQAIRDAADRATALTRQLLAFARKQILDSQVLDLNGLILNLDRLLRRLIGEDVELVTLPASDLGYIKADANQIEQVLVNLAVNARDAMPNGGKLTIETANVILDDIFAQQHVSVIPGAYIMLAVGDTGIGIPPEQQAHVFEPFFTTKESSKGTGLGLATCYGIIKQHGGNIWVYSEVGRGTTFKVYLPRTSEAASALPTSQTEEAARGGHETVLLTEDEEAVRRLTARVLRSLGYTVLEAADGEEALHISGEYGGVIDMLLTDVVLPRFSGLALAEQLLDRRPSVKVLFMSGHTDHTIVHHGVLVSSASFLQKPFSSELLARKIREVLGTRTY